MPGCEDKAAELCRRGALEVVRGWELPYVVDGKPTTIAFAARPTPGGVALVGSIVPQDYANAVGEASRSFHEIVELEPPSSRAASSGSRRANQGIRQLHEELAQQADRLRSSNEVKSRLVASVGHEFRTPLHSILGLSRLLLDESDGALNQEQQTQVRFIRDSAEELSMMVNDMLDLSRLDAGSAPIRASTFELGHFLSAVRGTMRPLLREDRPVELVFSPVPDVALETDQGKLAQIVRNLISNALKFTERGSVRVTATVDGEHLCARGRRHAASASRRRICRGCSRSSSRSTARSSAACAAPAWACRSPRSSPSLLGGPHRAREHARQGLDVHADRPARAPRDRRSSASSRARRRRPTPARAGAAWSRTTAAPVFVYERYLAMAGLPGASRRPDHRPARRLLHRAGAPVRDPARRHARGRGHLELPRRAQARAGDPRHPGAGVHGDEPRVAARALGADEFWLKPVDRGQAAAQAPDGSRAVRGAKVLVVDDDTAARYLIRKCLTGTPYTVLEATDGPLGVRLAASRSGRDVILLDFLLENATAFDVLDVLKADPRTQRDPGRSS